MRERQSTTISNKFKIEQVFVGVGNALKKLTPEAQGKGALDLYDKLKFPTLTPEEQKIADKTHQFLDKHRKAVGWTAVGSEAVIVAGVAALGYKLVRDRQNAPPPAMPESFDPRYAWLQELQGVDGDVITALREAMQKVDYIEDPIMDTTKQQIMILADMLQIMNRNPKGVKEQMADMLLDTKGVLKDIDDPGWGHFYDIVAKNIFETIYHLSSVRKQFRPLGVHVKENGPKEWYPLSVDGIFMRWVRLKFTAIFVLTGLNLRDKRNVQMGENLYRLFSWKSTRFIDDDTEEGWQIDTQN